MAGTLDIRCSVLVLFDDRGRDISALASAVSEGASRVAGLAVATKPISEAIQADLLNADAVILGSPNWSGMTGAFKEWLDDQGDLWEEGSLTGKVGAAFTTGRGRHAGLEFTLLGLIHWMLACGMIVVGLPWNDRMLTSGSYYGATAAGPATREDLHQARELGTRVGRLALRLADSPA